MNKKAQVLGYLIVLGLVVSLISYYIWTKTITPPETNTQFPGELQLYLLNAAQYEQAMNIYLGASMPRVVEEVLFRLAEDGGASRECPKYLGNYMWSSACNNNIYENFERAIFAPLAAVITLYPNQETEVRFDDQLSVIQSFGWGSPKIYAAGNRIVGMMSQPAEIKLLYAKPGKEKRHVGSYEFVPKFDERVSYNMDTLADIQNGATALVKAKKAINLNVLKIGKFDTKAGGCAPRDATELFYDVVEKIQFCMNVEQDTALCRCDLSQTELQALGQYRIAFEAGENIVASLTANDKVLNAHEFEEPIALYMQKKDEEFSLLSFVPEEKITLSWDAGTTIESSSNVGAISSQQSLFRYKKEGTNVLVFVPTAQRTELYEQFPACPLPTRSVFRACVNAGTIAGKQLEFRVAIATS